jgi:hypothetical protein
VKVFISWSGEKSRAVAEALRDWIPMVVQSAQPFLSSEDIDAGTRWADRIGKELDQTDFGIICVTADNWNKPWISFEAGALSKKFEEGRVAPLLFEVGRADISGPLVQFQSSMFEQQEVLKLLQSLNKSSDENSLADDVLGRVFDKMWPDLDERFQEISTKFRHINKPSNNKERTQKDMIEELINLQRANTEKLSLILNYQKQALKNPKNELELHDIDKLSAEITGESVADVFKKLEEVVSREKSRHGIWGPKI